MRKRRVCRILFDHQEPLTISRHVIVANHVTGAREVASLEQPRRRAGGPTGSAALDGDSHQRAIGCHIEEFPPARPPERLHAAGGRDLPQAIAHGGKRPDVDLVPAGAVRLVRQPAAIGRDDAAALVEARLDERLHPRRRREGQQPQVARLGGRRFEDEDARAVGRDAGRKLRIRAVGQPRDGPGAIGRLDVEIRYAGAG